MSAITILSPQLANRIAAGEVIERPSSVVKELVENSLDAGTNKISIEIERGGTQLIRIHDNGSGIAKEDLILALERHATSKIKYLEDLEKIMSMGFRGEALASISSVSRLILTSRVEPQKEAWQAYAEGRTMNNITLKPTAHPIGTTVDVIDLFYNTPARRSFLRTEKTEFNHIDDLVRQIALSRFDVAINLHHNSKLIRQYRATNVEEQYEKRLAAICGSAFMQNALYLYWQHGDLIVQGWVAKPCFRNTATIQYFYVNGRIISDRLINHAIRQAYADSCTNEQQAAYVLYLKIDPHQVDVNVHPTKREVRFYQARFVHDFIYQGVMTVLNKTTKIDNFKEKNNALPFKGQNRLAAGQNCFHATQHLMIERPTTDTLMELNSQVLPAKTSSLAVQSMERTNNYNTFGKILTICSKHFALMESFLGISLLSLNEAHKYLKITQLIPTDKCLKSQPLLIRITLALKEQEIATFYIVQELLNTLGFDIRIYNQTAIIRGISHHLISANWTQLFPKLLDYLANNISCQVNELVVWLTCQLLHDKQVWTIEQGIQLLADLELACPELVQEPPPQLRQIINFESIIQKFYP